MKKATRIVTLLLIFNAISILGQENLIKNGDFEKIKSNGKPENWYIDWSLYHNLDDNNPHNGQYSLKLYTNGGSIKPYGEVYNKNIAVCSSCEYKLSYWYRGNVKRYGTPVSTLLTTLYFFKDNQQVSKEEKRDEMVTPTSEWKKKEIIFTVPDGVTSLNFFMYLAYIDGGLVWIDDVELVLVKKVKNIELPKPTSVKVRTYQREALITWEKNNDASIKWEIIVDHKPAVVVADNSYLVTGLNPESSHAIKIRTIKGEEKSEYVDLKFITNAMMESKNSSNRIPHLRTIPKDGQLKQRFLELYYNDLANADAKITYSLDGVELKPVNNKITFPENKKYHLSIVVEESPELIWNLEYQIEIK